MSELPAPVLSKYQAADGPVRVLFLMATEQEYGPALQSRIVPLITGVGPVEAAIKTTHYLAGCSEENLPDLVISLGSAGSDCLPQGSIHQVSASSYRDMDASPLGFDKGVTPFSDLPAEHLIRHQVDDLPTASLSTGADIVNGERYNDFSAHMADMETYAHLRAAHHFNIPLIGFRGITDGTDPIEEFSDWTKYLAHIDESLAKIIDELGATFAKHSVAHWKAL